MLANLDRLARLLITFKLTPRSISWGSAVFGFAAGCFLAFGLFSWGSGSALLAVLLHSLIDRVARLKNLVTHLGEVRDATIDCYVEFFFLAGLAIYYRERPLLLILVLLAMMGTSMLSYSTAKAQAMKVDPPRGNMNRYERAVYLITGASLSPLSITWIEPWFYSGPVPIGYPMIFAVGIVGVLANFSAAERLYSLGQQMRYRNPEPAVEDSLSVSAASDRESVQHHEIQP